MAYTIPTNKTLWNISIITNILIGIFGVLILVSGILISVKLEGVETFSLILIIFGVFVAIFSIITMCCARRSSCFLLIAILLHFILLALVVVIAVYFSIDHDKIIDFIVKDKEENQYIRENIGSNLDIAKISSYVMSGIIVSLI